MTKRKQVFAGHMPESRSTHSSEFDFSKELHANMNVGTIGSEKKTSEHNIFSPEYKHEHQEHQEHHEHEGKEFSERYHSFLKKAEKDAYTHLKSHSRDETVEYLRNKYGIDQDKAHQIIDESEEVY